MDDLIDLFGRDNKVSRKRKSNNDFFEIQMKLLALEKLEEELGNKKLQGRKLSMFLNKVEKNIKSVNKELNKVANDNVLLYATLVAINKLVINIVNQIRKESNNVGKKFNLVKFLKAEKKKIERKINRMKKEDDKKIKFKKHKKSKKESDEEYSDYEETSDNETTGDEDDEEYLIDIDDDGELLGSEDTDEEEDEWEYEEMNELTPASKKVFGKN